MRRFTTWNHARLLSLVMVVIVAMSGLVGTSGLALADKGGDDKAGDDHGGHGSDDGTPGGGAFGGWLYEGTCDSLNPSPKREIGDLEQVSQESDADDLARLQLPQPAPSPIWMEDEDLDLTVSDLTTTPHAVVVRASEDVSSDVIACGEVTNAPVGDAPFMFPLNTVDDSGYTGKVLVSSRIDTHEADILVGVWEGTSQATPASGTPAA